MFYVLGYGTSRSWKIEVRAANRDKCVCDEYAKISSLVSASYGTLYIHTYRIRNNNNNNPQRLCRGRSNEKTWKKNDVGKKIGKKEEYENSSD